MRRSKSIPRRSEPVYHQNEGRSRIGDVTESRIELVLADTGWYDIKTNMDADGTQAGHRRERWVKINGVDDPMLLTDSLCMTTPGGTLVLSGRNPGYKPAKDRTPYLDYMRRVTTNTGASWSRYIESSLGEKVKGKSHPRFTAIKAVLRKLRSVDERRNKLIAQQRDRILKVVQFPYDHFTKNKGDHHRSQS